MKPQKIAIKSNYFKPTIKQKSISKINSQISSKSKTNYNQFKNNCSTSFTSLKQISYKSERKLSSRKSNQSVLQFEISKIKQTSNVDFKMMNSTKVLRSTQQSINHSLDAHYTSIFHFKKLKTLGKGKFGRVELVQHKYTGYIAALKIISKQQIKSCDKKERQKRILQLTYEIKLQMFLKHSNLIQLYCYFHDYKNVYLLMELGSHGQLYDLMIQNRHFTEETTALIIRDLLHGVKYMHKFQIIHRDIKPENIVFSFGVAKICDFGWSVQCSTNLRSTLCGTPLYFSPEILQGQSYNKKIDIWALGILCYELYTGKNPFKISKKQQLSKIVKEKFIMNEGSSLIRNFISFILQKNPKKRPNIDVLLHHSFIEQYEGLQTPDQLFIEKY